MRGEKNEHKVSKWTEGIHSNSSMYAHSNIQNQDPNECAKAQKTAQDTIKATVVFRHNCETCCP